VIQPAQQRQRTNLERWPKAWLRLWPAADRETFWMLAGKGRTTNGRSLRELLNSQPSFSHVAKWTRPVANDKEQKRNDFDVRGDGFVVT
jgi:hypothetical protein